MQSGHSDLQRPQTARELSVGQQIQQQVLGGQTTQPTRRMLQPVGQTTQPVGQPTAQTTQPVEQTTQPLSPACLQLIASLFPAANGNIRPLDPQMTSLVPQTQSMQPINCTAPPDSQPMHQIPTQQACAAKVQRVPQTTLQHQQMMQRVPQEVASTQHPQMVQRTGDPQRPHTLGQAVNATNAYTGSAAGSGPAANAAGTDSVRVVKKRRPRLSEAAIARMPQRKVCCHRGVF